MRCPICNGGLRRSREGYSFGGVKLGEFEADKCTECGEVFFTEEASDEIDRKAKERGLWGIGKVSKVSYAGNSMIVRIPQRIVRFMDLERGDQILIHPEGKTKLVLEVQE